MQLRRLNPYGGIGHDKRPARSRRDAPPSKALSRGAVGPAEAMRSHRPSSRCGISERIGRKPQRGVIEPVDKVV